MPQYWLLLSAHCRPRPLTDHLAPLQQRLNSCAIQPRLALPKFAARAGQASSRGISEISADLEEGTALPVHPYDGGLVFARREPACLIARIQGVLRNAATWGEFRAAMPREVYSARISHFDLDCHPRPKDSDAFTSLSAPGVEEGRYPTWLQLEMDRLLPHALLQQFGMRTDTFLNDSLLPCPTSRSAPWCPSSPVSSWRRSSPRTSVSGLPPGGGSCSCSKPVGVSRRRLPPVSKVQAGLGRIDSRLKSFGAQSG